MTEVSHPLEATEYSPQPVRTDLETETLGHSLDLGLCWLESQLFDQRAKARRDLQMRKLRHRAPKCLAHGRTEARPGLTQGSCLPAKGSHPPLLAAAGLSSCRERRGFFHRLVDVDFSPAGTLGVSLPSGAELTVSGEGQIPSFSSPFPLCRYQERGAGAVPDLALSRRQALERSVRLPAPGTEPPQPHGRGADVCEQGAV